MALQEHRQALTESLAKAGLVPGVAEKLIPTDFQPSIQLDISFAGKEVKTGNFFRSGECKLAPSVSFVPEDNDAAANASYMLLLVDPDAPTPDDPKFAFWRHWVLPGLQPIRSDQTIVAQTKFPLTEFLGPSPKDEFVKPIDLKLDAVHGAHAPQMSTSCSLC
jgi:phosphatidylethanolamine-binding protein